MRYWANIFKLTNTNWLIDLSIWLILLMPLILYVDVNNPFSFGRYVIFMVVAIPLVLGLFFVKTIKFRYLWWKHPIFWITLIWLIIGIISSVMGVNPFRSWWGTASRSTGMFFYIGLWLVSWFLLLAVNHKEQWLKMLSIMSWVGGISAFYAILQELNIPFVIVTVSGGSSRASALMGNPIFMGQLLLFTIFLTLYFVLGSAGKIRWYYLASLILQVVAVFISASRGPLLALLISGLIWLVGIWYIYRGKIKLNWRWLVGGGGIAALVVGLIFALVPIANIARIFEVYNSSLQARLFTWQTAWHAIQDRALLGYGNENAWFALTKFYQPGLAGLAFGETIVDRAHNFVLDQMIANGWVGLIIELILLAYVLILLTNNFKIHIIKNNPEKSILAWSLLAVVIAYFVANLTAFETITTAIYGGVILVAVIALTSSEWSGAIKPSYAWIWRTVSGVLAIGLIFFNFKYLVPAFKIGQYVDVANDAYRANDYLSANKAYAKAQETINPYRWSFLINYPSFARKYSILLLTDKPAAAMAIAEDGLRVATNIRKQEPDRVAIFMEFPILYTTMAYYTPIYTAKAQESFDELTKEFPHHEYIYLNWARALMGVSKYQEAGKALDQLAERFTITPTSFEFWRALNDIQLKSRDNTHIIADLNTAIHRKAPFVDGDQDILRIITGYLVQHNQWELAKYYQEHIVRLSPDNVEEIINLSAICAELKDYDKAAELARKVVKLDPSKTDTTKQFLQSIGRDL